MTGTVKCGMKLLIHPPLQRYNHLSVGMDKSFYPIFYDRCNYLSIPGIKLKHVSCRKRPYLSNNTLLAHLQGRSQLNQEEMWTLDVHLQCTYIRGSLFIPQNKFVNCFSLCFFSVRMHVYHQLLKDWRSSFILNFKAVQNTLVKSILSRSNKMDAYGIVNLLLTTACSAFCMHILSVIFSLPISVGKGVIITANIVNSSKSKIGLNLQGPVNNTMEWLNA